MNISREEKKAEAIECGLLSAGKYEDAQKEASRI